jgi:hypothetical protein
VTLARHVDAFRASCEATVQVRPSTAAVRTGTAWKTLQDQGFDVNPCGSKHHPAVKVGVLPETEDVKSLQEAYTPWSTCFGCGTMH